MQLRFDGVLWYWRGPAPFHFLTVPPEACDSVRQVSSFVTYGWGMIPVTARIGETVWTTSLWPKDGTYILPVKAAVRRATGIELDDRMTAELTIGRT